MKSIKVCEYSRSRSFHYDLILQDQASGERSQDQWSSGSEASRPILIKFNVNHNWVGGLMALGFGADCIKIVVSMATDRSHRLTMGKTKKIFFSETTRPTALIFGM